MNSIIPLPMVSIITPVLNNRNDLEACIRSVAEQTWPHKEHWIIDGGSTDGTLELIRRYASEWPHIHWLSQKDKGIYDAMNHGIELAGGEWLCFLGSDDLLYSPTVLEEIFTNKSLISCDILYGNIILRDSGEVLGEEVDLEKLKIQCTHHQATFTRKEIFNTFGKYNTDYKVCADWAFTIQCFRTPGLKIRYMDKTIAVYSDEGFSKSSSILSPRARDRMFRADFEMYFEKFSCSDRFRFFCDNFLPKYMNPYRYAGFIRRRIFRKKVRTLSDA
jgi:glycosyltransferase involved in cell wall biosynthesis